MTKPVTSAKKSSITIADYPELKLLCWNYKGSIIDGEIALGIYERNWHHVDQNLLTEPERSLIATLSEIYRNGVLHV